MRLDKYTAHLADSRREIRKIIANGMVTVNGSVVRDGGYAVSDCDVVEYGGSRVLYREFIYLIMNKPQDVISATDDPRHKTVVDLLSAEHRRFQPFPVGRLDIDTEGLLLLTNDGDTAHRLLSPKRKVPKKYFARLDAPITDNDIKRFKRGIVLDDGYKTMPAILERAEDESCAYVTIAEGKFHQVKRMFADVGKQVLYLQRVEFASLTLDNSLACGEYREILPHEMQALEEITK